jgi:hypothetical protein
MNENHQQIEVVTGAASRIITSLQSAIFSAMEASASGVQAQVKMASAFQKLEMQEQILGWLIQRRIDQEERLNDANLRPAQRIMIEHKISQVDFELASLLRSSGVDENVASKAVADVVERKRIPKGQPGAGQYLPSNSNEA